MLNDVRYVRSLQIRDRCEGYPFTIPSINKLNALEFHEKVTYIIGDNGSGKSTILEAIAIALRINPEGGNRNTRFSLLNTESELHKHITVVKGTPLCRNACALTLGRFIVTLDASG